MHHGHAGRERSVERDPCHIHAQRRAQLCEAERDGSDAGVLPGAQYADDTADTE